MARQGWMTMFFCFFLGIAICSSQEIAVQKQFKIRKLTKQQSKRAILLYKIAHKQEIRNKQPNTSCIWCLLPEQSSAN